MPGTRVPKNSRVSGLSVSHGGLPTMQEKPPRQPCRVVTCSLSSACWKIPGNSRCQWKNLCSRATRSMSAAVCGSRSVGSA